MAAQDLTITIGLAASLLLHGGLLAAASVWIDRKSGAVVVPVEAISVELVESEVLEAVRKSSLSDAAASSSSVQTEIGFDENETAAAGENTAETERQGMVASSAHQQVEKQDSHRQKGEAISAEAPGIVQETVEHVLKPAAATNDTEEVLPLAERQPSGNVMTKRKAPPRSHKAQRQAKKGSTISRAATGSSPSSGRVSASTGSIINYAARVRARVASRRPRGPGKRGTVVVAFGLTRSGQLAFASVSRSSGDAVLDQNVLSALRGAAPFPKPPPGASPHHLRFSIPFHFK
jgi:protein TonB